jgi:hypothetical protein
MPYCADPFDLPENIGKVAHAFHSLYQRHEKHLTARIERPQIRPLGVLSAAQAPVAWMKSYPKSAKAIVLSSSPGVMTPPPNTTLPCSSKSMTLFSRGIV